MKLRDWMTSNGHDDASFAALVADHIAGSGGCARKTVEKWRYGTRTPRRKMLPVISRITNGQVTPNDFAEMPAHLSNSQDTTGKVA